MPTLTCFRYNPKIIWPQFFTILESWLIQVNSSQNYGLTCVFQVYENDWWRVISLSCTSTHLKGVVMFASLLLTLSLSVAGSPEILTDATPATPVLQDPLDWDSGEYCVFWSPSLDSNVIYCMTPDGTQHSIWGDDLWEFMLEHCVFD